jgi:hypothetical protein
LYVGSGTFVRKIRYSMRRGGCVQIIMGRGRTESEGGMVEGGRRGFRVRGIIVPPSRGKMAAMRGDYLPRRKQGREGIKTFNEQDMNGVENYISGMVSQVIGFRMWSISNQCAG